MTTNYYVDPNAGSDSNNGTSDATAWLTTQHALNTIAQGAAGDQINIKHGTDDTLAAALTLATYGTPTAVKPLIFRGYTTTANDGGIGGLNGGGSFSIIADTTKGPIMVKDMHLHNCGANVIWQASGSVSNSVEHCEVDTGTARGIILGTSGTATISNCYIHDISGTDMANAANIQFCRVEILSGTAPTSCINPALVGIYNTIASKVAITQAILTTGSAKLIGNSVWSNAGTGAGITMQGGSAGWCSDNVIEGFSGVGGNGIKGTGILGFYGSNSFYHCTTTNGLSGAIWITLTADQTLSGSPFTNPTASPPDLSLNATASAGASCRAAGYPGAYYGSPFTSYRDDGAIQHADPAGGSGGGNILVSSIIQGLGAI